MKSKRKIVIQCQYHINETVVSWSHASVASCKCAYVRHRVTRVAPAILTARHVILRGMIGRYLVELVLQKYDTLQTYFG